MTWEADRSETQHSTLDALEAFIASQRALISRQRADIDRLQHLKNDLSLRPGHLFDHLSEELDDPAFKLSSCADLKLRLPSSISWKAFDRSDPTPLHALSLSIPTRTPLATQTAPLSELQSFVKNAARTLLEPRMHKYPRVPTPPPDSDSDLDAHDPITARREREQAKIRELKDMVRRGGGSGLRTMRMGLIRTDVGEESMRAEVRIDDDDANDDNGGASLTEKRPGKGKRVPGHSRIGKHTGKHYGKTVSFHPSQANEDTFDNMVATSSPAPSHATKNIGLVAEHARSAAASPEPVFDVPEPLDMDTSVDHHPVDHDELQLSAVESQSPAQALDAPPTSKAKPRQRTRAKPNSKPKANSKRAKPSYEYTDDESELDLDLTHDAPEEDEPEYQDPRDFVPSVTIHPSDSSEDEAVAMDVDIPVRKSNTAKKPKKPKARTKKAKDKASASGADRAFASDDYDSDAAHPTASTTSTKASRPRKPPKPKPETYKQAWSTDEQNLLEQLLEEIPDGERFRWQKISRAMGGRRTPRQVASRVQKYFEKLKKYDLM